jgi:hypothetical protein
LQFSSGMVWLWSLLCTSRSNCKETITHKKENGICICLNEFQVLTAAGVSEHMAEKIMLWRITTAVFQKNMHEALWPVVARLVQSYFW